MFENPGMSPRNNLGKNVLYFVCIERTLTISVEVINL
jgi:hypothetical protein